MKLHNNLSNNASKEYKVYEDLGTVVSVLDDVVYIAGLFNDSMSEHSGYVGKELKRGKYYSVKFCSNKGVRHRTRRITQRYLIERFYFRKLNKDKKKEAYASLARVKKDLDSYVWTELYYIKKLQLYCFTIGIINSLLIGDTIVTKLAPFVLFQHLSPGLQFIYAGFTLGCLGLSFILRYYIYLKEVRFLDTYDYKCNPAKSVREAMVFLSSKNLVYTFLSTSAGLVTVDYMYMAATGNESVFTTLGKSAGIYQKGNVIEVYDLKSIKEAVELQQQELKDIKAEAVYEYRKEVLDKFRNTKSTK